MEPPLAPPTVREDQLARVAFFDGLTREALSLIAQVTTEESHALGTRIFQYGDPGDKLFIILEGKVRISREVSGMGEEALAVLGPGQVFGEMALLGEWPRMASVRATTAVECLGMDRWVFLAHLTREPGLAVKMLQILAQRLAEVAERLVD